MEERIDGRSLRYQHRRGELLEAVGEYALDNGIASLSLRRVADAVGVSHVTLQHHFGSKEQLVEEIVEHLLGRTLVPDGVDTSGMAEPSIDIGVRWRALWAHLTTPGGERDIRLFVEVLGQSLYEGTGYAPAVERSITNRLDLITANMIRLGCPEQEARANATVALATIRGLIVDLMATGDTERLNKAFELTVANAERRAAEWSSAARAAGARPSRRPRKGARRGVPA